MIEKVIGDRCIAILYVIVWVQGKGSSYWDILQDIDDVTEFSHNYNQSVPLLTLVYEMETDQSME